MWRVALLALASCGRLDFDGLPACPDGFVAVAGSSALGTRAFCVMQFEARAADARATATSTGVPWTDVTALAAADACAALGPGYDLLANREWMTIARDAERAGANWEGGAPGAGRIVEGRTDKLSMPGFGVTDPTDPYSDTSGDWAQRRTLALSTGDVIWDLSGNVQEWVDWTLGSPYDGAPPCAGGELPTLACPGYAPDDYQSLAGTYDTMTGVGLVIGGNGDAARRGGERGDRPPGYAGIYALNMNRFKNQSFPATGFRCVLRLP